MAETLNLKIKIDADTGEIKVLNSQLDKTSKSAKNADKSLGGISSSLKGIAVAVGGLVAVNKALDLMGKSIEIAASFEKMETVLTTIEGSGERAKQSMDWITEFTASTPYELQQVGDAFVKLKAYGIEPTNGLLKTLGDTSSAMGKDLIQSVEAYADALVGENERLKEFGIKTKVVGEEITYSWNQNGEEMTKTVQKNATEQGDALVEIFSRFDGAMELQSKTFDGLVSNMSDNFTQMANDIATKSGAFDLLKGYLSEINKEMKSINVTEAQQIESAKTVINTMTEIAMTLTYVSDGFNYLQLGVGVTFNTMTVFIDEFQGSLYDLGLDILDIQQKMIELLPEELQNEDLLLQYEIQRGNLQRGRAKNQEEINKSNSDYLESFKTQNEDLARNEEYRLKIEIQRGKAQEKTFKDIKSKKVEIDNSGEEEKLAEISAKRINEIEQTKRNKALDIWNNYYEKLTIGSLDNIERLNIKYEKDLENYGKTEEQKLLITKEYSRLMVEEYAKMEEQNLQTSIKGINETFKAKEEALNFKKEFNLESDTPEEEQDMLIGDKQQLEIDALTLQYEKKEELLKLHNASVEEIEAVNKAKKDELEKKTIEFQLKNTTKGLNAVQSATDSFAALGLISEKKAAKASQAIAIGKAMISTYQGAATALTMGPIIGPIMAAVTVANGLAQIAQIKSQKFHNGGYIENVSSDAASGLRTDEVPATLQTGEGVLSRQGMANLDKLNEGGAGETSIAVFDDRKKMDEWAQSREGKAIIKDMSQ